ncbi:MAG: Rossmann-like domain-containing protein [Promethearchaeota archaeon]
MAKQLVDDGSSWLPNPANLKIGMIGAIHSVLRRIVTEKGEVLLRDDTLRQRQCHRLPKNGINLVSSVDELKNVDHLLVTGSAIIHKDIGKILAILPFIQGERVLIGPSAQILPQAAFKDGFTIIASSWVEQVKETMQNISEGGGYHIFQKYCRKYVIRKPKIP